MSLSNLFSNTLKTLQNNNVPQIFQTTSSVYDPIILLETSLLESYKSEDDDLEDLRDIIQIINISLEYAIINVNIKDNEIGNLFKTRISGKKKIKEKYNDVKNKNRMFWNYDECDEQYSDFIKYVWKPSLIKLKQLISIHRKDMVVGDRPIRN